MDLLTAFVCKCMFEKNNLKQQEENLDGERERPCWSTVVRTCSVASIKRSCQASLEESMEIIPMVAETFINEGMSMRGRILRALSTS